MSSFGELFAEASDAPAYFDKDTTIGEVLEGEITALSLRQTRDHKTKKPEFWDDGTPRQQFVLVVNTGMIQFDGDDGKRSVYIKWWGAWRKAFAKAVLATAAEPEIGGMLRAVYVGLGEPSAAGMSPAKLYDYEYQPPGATLSSPATGKKMGKSSE